MLEQGQLPTPCPSLIECGRFQPVATGKNRPKATYHEKQLGPIPAFLASTNRH